MTLINDVPANELIGKTSQELKKINEIKPPQWAAFCKTGMHKERAPSDKDWWYFRAAAILRTTALKGPIGVSKLRTKFGGRKNRGHKPDKFYRGSGNIIRKIFQQLEKAELIKKSEIDIHKGRIITAKGESLLDKIAIIMIKAMPKPKKKAKPAEEAAEEAEMADAEKTAAKEIKEEKKERKEPKKEKITIST